MQFYANGYKPGDPFIEDPHPSVAERPEGLPENADVLIIGCGPAGLVLAAQMANFPDIRTVVIDRKDGPLEVGQADGVACRTVGGSGLGVLSAQDDVEAVDRQAVQQLIDGLAAAGIEAHGEIVSATEHDVAEVILQRAQELDVDLLVLGHQHHRGAGNLFQSSVAERVIRQHPPYSILLARPPQISSD